MYLNAEGAGAFRLRMEKKMWIESSLRRLKDNVNHFVIPSVALRNVDLIEAQIEFRRQALREIEVIRCQLRPFMRRESQSLQRRDRSRRR
jgi:hypothetical protein